MKYIEYGLPFAERQGFSLVPVELNSSGRFRRRRLPKSITDDSHGLRTRIAKLSLELTRYLVRIGVSFLGFLHAIIPLRIFHTLSRSAGLIISQVRNLLLDTAVVTEPGDILFCPGYWHEVDESVYAEMSANGVEVVLVVHDILPITHPFFYPPIWRRVFETRLLRLLTVASHFYCVSSKTRADLIAFAERNHKQIRATVAPNGFEAAKTKLASTGLPSVVDRRPWLMVGTIEPKKGYDEVITTFESLWTTGYKRPLAVVGRRGWMSEQIIHLIETSRWSDDQLFWFPSISDPELFAFYDRAHALLFASFAEGFGLPLLEATTHGLPILARESSVFREFLGEGARYFLGMADMPAAVLALEQEAVYQAARQSVVGLTWFDWRTVVEAVFADVLEAPDRRHRGSCLVGQHLRRSVVA